jgi:hypothetical protein
MTFKSRHARRAGHATNMEEKQRTESVFFRKSDVLLEELGVGGSVT